MPVTKKGKRTAEFQVQIVQEGKKINLYLHDESHKYGPIVFREDTGMSGTKAYGKLAKMLDDAESREAKEHS